MAADSNAIEQAVSRTLRDNLVGIQRQSEELHQAITDLISACASSRPANALPPMIRAHTYAASLAASLEVLSKLVTSTMQPDVRSSLEHEISRATSLIAQELATPVVQPEAAPAHPMHQGQWSAPVPVEERPTPPMTPAVEEIPTMAPVLEAPAISSNVVPISEAPPAGEILHSTEPVYASEPVPVFVHEPLSDLDPVMAPESAQASETVEAERIFSLDLLPPEEQELHRRAYRVAKVSMQDIKMLRPEDVRLGRENKDLCFRLRDDIEKAHKEYDRRFQPIQSHPVDYFYDWMVEILGGGDPQALGEYPYPSPVLRR
jgi:hypothetical protein